MAGACGVFLLALDSHLLSPLASLLCAMGLLHKSHEELERVLFLLGVSLW